MMEWLIFAAAITLGVFATTWFTQEHFIFFPQPITSTPHLPSRAEPLEVVAAAGKRLRGWIVKSTMVPAPTVIYFGGNAEEVSWTLADARWPRKWTIAGLNYRGYGASEGAPGEPELSADALAIYDAVSLPLRHRFNALADANRSRMPLLAVVGEVDSVIPPERSPALFDAWSGPKTWLVVRGAGHNTLGASDVFWGGVAHFLAGPKAIRSTAFAR